MMVAYLYSEYASVRLYSRQDTAHTTHTQIESYQYRIPGWLQSLFLVPVIFLSPIIRLCFFYPPHLETLPTRPTVASSVETSGWFSAISSKQTKQTEVS